MCADIVDTTDLMSDVLSIFLENRMKAFRVMCAWAVVIACIGSSIAFATGFNVGVSGTKKVTISNRVGTNQITFESSAPLEDIKGTANEISGSFMLDPANIEAATGIITVKVKSMQTGIGKRDAHLMSGDWLNEAQYPTITFSIKSIRNVKSVSSDNGKAVVQAVAVGDFTMHGVTKQIDIPVTMTYIRESEKTRERAPGDFVMIQGDFSIALKDFKVEGTKGTIGSKVGETIMLKANFFGSTGL